MMKPEIRTRWVTALRGSRFEQGQGKLRNEHDEYCCLGVLCQLAAEDGIIPDALWDYDTWSYVGHREYLPEAVWHWAGLDRMNPFIYIPDPDYPDDPEEILESSLSEFNDTGHSFDEIADIIEDQL